jgi:hypothetical protein
MRCASGRIAEVPSMQLLLRDQVYTERLASFLKSLGLRPIVDGPLNLELQPVEGKGPDRAELEIYLRVWRVLYPDAEIEIVDRDERARAS